MSAFEFIVDKDLRQSLQSDWSELQAAFDNLGWKSVHVLAGSIVEAILIDHLISINHQDKDPLRMSLEDAISACKKLGVLSDKTAELSTVVRRYRNLIHPGRSLRLSERADVHGANVCKSLVSIISEEVAKAKRQSYGYTAEQIASKIERDASALAILSHLLKRTNEREIERLLLELLPDRYQQLMNDPEEASTSETERIAKAFHSAFEVATASAKERVAKRFISVLQEEDGSVVRTYEEVFFRTVQLEFLPADDLKIVKQHAISEMDQSPSAPLFAAFMGIAKYLEDDEIPAFVDAAVRHLADSKKKHLHKTCSDFLDNLYITLPSGRDQRVLDRGEVWVKFLKERTRHDDAERVQGAFTAAITPF